MLTADAGMACWVATSSHAATRCSHAASETIFPIRRPEYHSIQVERHTVKQNDRSVESVTTQQTVHNIYEYRSLLLLTSKCYYYYNLTLTTDTQPKMYKNKNGCWLCHSKFLPYWISQGQFQNLWCSKSDKFNVCWTLFVCVTFETCFYSLSKPLHRFGPLASKSRQKMEWCPFPLTSRCICTEDKAKCVCLIQCVYLYRLYAFYRLQFGLGLVYWCLTAHFQHKQAILCHRSMKYIT